MAYYYTLDSEFYFVQWSVGASFVGSKKLPDNVVVPEALQACSCNVRAYKYIDGVITYDSEREDICDVYAPAGGSSGSSGSSGGSGGSGGADGEDGVSCYHSWDGTILTITSASGTSSADLKGEKGDKGDTGAQGEKGDTGAAGADGAKGDKGDTGAAGSDGADGVSCTHSWDGTTLTVTSASGSSSADLKGEKGDKGDTGAQGEKGDTGAAGADGAKGDKGDTGAAGADGADGADGVSCTHSWDGTTLTVTSASGSSSADLKGEKGDKGDTGAAGSDGAAGKSAYAYAQDGGYTGTEAEFAALLAGGSGSVEALTADEIRKICGYGYTQLEYIESTGTQYIDIGIKANQDTKVVMDVQSVSANPNETGTAFFGARKSSSSQCYGVYWHKNSVAYYSFYNTGYSQGASSLLTERMIVTQDKNVTTVGDITIERTYAAFQCDYNLYLFTMNNGGTAQYFGLIRVYGCQIYDNGTLIRDLVPAEKDGAIGLYDRLNNKFYANAGTGSFTAGAAVAA